MRPHVWSRVIAFRPIKIHIENYLFGLQTWKPVIRGAASTKSSWYFDFTDFMHLGTIFPCYFLNVKCAHIHLYLYWLTSLFVKFKPVWIVFSDIIYWQFQLSANESSNNNITPAR